MSSQSRPFTRARSALARLRSVTTCAALGALLGGTLAVGSVAVPALASATPTLMPAAGQYFPVTPVKVLDTRDGTGGVPVAPLAAGATSTFQVVGIGQILSSGVSDVYVTISAISPQANGCLDDFSADTGDPGICTVPFEAGFAMSNSDIVAVSPAGYVSVSNNSAGSTDVVVSVMGYYSNDQMASGSVAGDTYVPLSDSTILDTRSGIGAPQAQVPAGGSLTIQVTGKGGMPQGAQAAALFVGAANETGSGYVSAYPAGGTSSSQRILSYAPNRTIRNLYFGALSSSGQLTLVNQGTVPVDLIVDVQGYLAGPSATPAGNSYQDVAEFRIADTRNGTGGIPATPVPPGGSITFAATGVDNVPSAGIAAVAESVAALNPTSNGFLSVYPAGTSDPNNPGVNFQANDPQDNDMAAPMLSQVSPTGNETITNHSSGTVDVVVSVRGYYQKPAVPSAPMTVADTINGSSATVTWSAPTTDGGSPITGYTVTAAPDTASVVVDSGTFTATLTGLSGAGSDTFAVTATNAAGTSIAGTSTLSAAGSQGADQQVSVITDPNAGTMTLAGTSSANTELVNPDGSTSLTAGTPDTSDVFSPTFSVGNCSKSAKNVTVLDNGTWNNYWHGNSYSLDWTHHQWEVKNAEQVTPQGGGSKYWTYQIMVCSTGGANTWNSWQMDFSGDAVYWEGTANGPMIGWHWGTKLDSHATVTRTLGFSLQGGSSTTYANITGAFTVGTSSTQVVANSQYVGDTGADGLFPGIPGTYNANRVNAFWTADNYSGLTGFSEGSTSEVLYEWPMSTVKTPRTITDWTRVHALCRNGGNPCANFR